jgi:hypothetical protein
MREKFRPGKPYPARLLAVETRPLENKSLVLLRLEFEVFLEGPNELRSLEKIACREIALGRTLSLPEDKGVARFFESLKLTGNMNSPQTWESAQKNSRWVAIVFGAIDHVDERNPFDSIVPYDASGKKVIESVRDLKKGWLQVSEAAEALGISNSTVIRRVNQFEAKFGTRLVRKSVGGHRSINLKLLRQLL